MLPRSQPLTAYQRLTRCGCRNDSVGLAHGRFAIGRHGKVYGRQFRTKAGPKDFGLADIPRPDCQLRERALAVQCERLPVRLCPRTEYGGRLDMRRAQVARGQRAGGRCPDIRQIMLLIEDRERVAR
jgi:hypothetical protein